MVYKIVFASDIIIKKDLQKIPKKELKLIFEKIEQISKEGINNNNNIKRLIDYLADYRLRVGDYRVLFDINNKKKEIAIFRILHRSKLY